jgi:flagellar motility protein MotE (MotC chaperone)
MNLRIVTRHLRLLPAVMIAGTVLLFLKGAGLVHDARAEGQSKVQTASAQAAPHAEPVARKDPASDDTETASAAEVDVLSSLTKRRTELDARGRDLDMRANVLAATEKRIDAKIAALKQLQVQINQMMGQRDAAQEKQIASLVKTYSAMKPKDAARIFNGLDENVLLEVAQAMKSDALAPVLAGMNAETAQKLTLRLASRLNVPEKATLTPPPQQASATAPSPAPAATQPPPSPAPAPTAIQPPPSPAPAATKAAASPAPAPAVTKAAALSAPVPQAATPQAAAPQAAPPPAKHG